MLDVVLEFLETTSPKYLSSTFVWGNFVVRDVVVVSDGEQLRTGLRGEKSLFLRTDEVDAFDEEDHVAGMSSPNKKCCATGYFPRTSPANI